MIYAIQALQRLIKEHQAKIVKAENVESEMVSDDLFAQEEVTERRQYIYSLQKAIHVLSKVGSYDSYTNWLNSQLKQKKE